MVFTALSAELAADDSFFLDRDLRIQCINDDSLDHYVSNITLTHLPDNNIAIHTSSKYYQFKSLTDPQMKVLSFEASYDHPFYADQAGLRYYKASRLEGNDFFLERITERGKAKNMELELQSQGDFNQVKFLLPWVFFHQGVQEDFTLYLYEPSRNIEFHIRLITGRSKFNQIVQNYPQYTFPGEWKETLASEEDVYVVEAQLTGLAGAIYSHPFIYCMDSSFKMRLEWGGNPNKAYYTRYRYLALP